MISHLFGNYKAHSEITTFRGRHYTLLPVFVCVNLCLHIASKIKVNSTFVIRILMPGTGVWSNCTFT